MSTAPELLIAKEISRIRESRVFPQSKLPLLVEPAAPNVDLIQWVTDSANMHYLERKVLEHGGILFRNFQGMNATERFFEFCRSFSHPLLDYSEQSSPRGRLRDKVYSSTTYPADQYIPFHNANSFGHEFPMNIWFSCIRLATSGGRTPICDTRRVLANLSETTRELFRNKGILYVRNYYESMGVPWEETFQTESRKEAERFFAAGKIAFKWGCASDRWVLATRQARHAILPHPKTGEEVWFNQAHLFHKRSMDKRLQPLLRRFEDQWLPRHAYFGDGSPIPDEIVDEIFAAFSEAELSFDCQEGDILMLDNLLTSHARTPFVGDQRLISVAFSEMFTDYSDEFAKYGTASF